MQITNKTADASKFTATGRGAIDCVAVYPDSGLILATNGHVCVTASKFSTVEDLRAAVVAETPYLVEPLVWTDLFRRWKKGSTLDIAKGWNGLTVSRDGAEPVTLPTVNDVGNMPPLADVWPLDFETPALTLGFTAATLTAVLKWMERGNSKKTLPYAMTFDHPLAPLTIHQKMGDGTHLRALVMPFRLSD